MPIFAYTGLPGHGKSYGVVENVILPALQQGRHVVTNIPLNEKRIRQDYKNGIISGFPMEAVKADPERVFEFALPGCVLVLDELWNLIPAGLAANKVPEPFKKLLAEHRHMVDVSGDSMSIYFVTQDCGQLAAFARILVEQTFHINKLNAVGLSKQYRLDIYNGVVTGQSPPVSKRVNSIMGTYKKKTFEYYQSHTQSQSEATGANERSIDSRGVFWKNWKFLAGGPIALGVLAWGIAQGEGTSTRKERSRRPKGRA